MKARVSLAILAFGLSPAVALAQDAASAAAPGAPVANCLPKGWLDLEAPYKSVEVLPDGRVTFRLCAPLARVAKVISPDLNDLIPGGATDGVVNGLAMTRDATGLWSGTTDRPVPAAPYRFNFQVDGAPVPDPRGTMWSEQVTGVTGVFEVPGPAGAFQAWRRDVPHGAVATIDYWSNALGVKRRAHVYTPPGYTGDARRYPVLYLVHGAGDTDDSWTSIGHANNILDNLIAEGKAVPMIVVMPAGHTPMRPNQNMLVNTDFGSDLTTDLIPLIDRSYRTVAQPQMRAMAGLSMGGAHTLNFGLPRSDLFRYAGIFSMGLGVQNPAGEVADYEARNAAALRRAAKDMKLVWYGMGKTDFLYGTVAPTRAMLDKYGIRHTYVETDGGHVWGNWRRYLSEFAQKLFR
ncbi:esterase [Nostoc sp. 3335mG]|nr:esterase [Nostoc sp. 3335mG]